MVEQRRSAPDVLDVNDAAIVHRDPPAPVWVDLAALTDHKRRGKPFNPDGARGVFVAGVVSGVLWAWVRTEGGQLWLGVVTMELERGGIPFASVPAVVPDWAITRRLPGSGRAYRGKTSNRPTAAQVAAQRE